MPNTFNNLQADPMTLNFANNPPVVVAGGGNAVVNHPITSIAYHGLTYTLVGAWVVADNVALDAAYLGGQNINLRTPQGFEVVYHYEGP